MKNYKDILKVILSSLLVILVFTGCGGPKIGYSLSPYSNNKLKHSDLFEVKISPSIGIIDTYYAEGVNSFNLEVKNKTNKDMKLIWDETYFLEKGNASGRFMFAGIKYSEREKSNLPDLILSNNTYTKYILPNVKVKYMYSYLTKKSEWVNTAIETYNSPVGIYLTVEIEGKKYNERVLYNLNSYKR